KGISIMQVFDRFHGIIPPYMLEALAKATNADPVARAAAQRSIALSDALRAERVAFDASLRTAHRAATVGPPHKHRLVYTAAHATTLPGTLARSEGQAASGDAAVDECYNGFGATFDFYNEILGRNSIDDAGMNMIGTVHYDQSYDNAFWNGNQMVFGDGDG